MVNTFLNKKFFMHDAYIKISKINNKFLVLYIIIYMNIQMCNTYY